ncbi:hypothetical protein [sulfur-oxidizing endosymbiont of Gigantopelta aegis]|uniref:CIS tube protein n=1 Tax=sulfur-oxidizing endosymbiont of Gigantopelta aegis TaxID=2794934 RepID=UPI0018DB5767|nr:hypothetical protein [sulfur-oxidizing endosymbiont of Gigantopelta aegis]
MIKTMQGMLLEYALSLPPLAVEFEFNPESLTRSRTVTFDGSALPIADFTTPGESNRIGQAASAAAETINFNILLDATDKLSDPAHAMHEIAKRSGVEPEIAALRSMLEPKVNGPDPFQIMSSLGGGSAHAHERNEHLSVLLFVWGSHVLPVFMTSLSIEEMAHLPQLQPYRAKATISLQVLESNNPFYQAEQVQRMILSAANLINSPLAF